MIDVFNLKKNFGDLHVLRGVNLSVKDGEKVSEVSDYYLFNEYSSLELNDFFLKLLN